MNYLPANVYARLSLVAITLTGFMTTLHHVYRLGLGVLIPFTVITLLLPYLLMRWYSRAANSVALWAYGLFNLLIFLWFGFIDGFLDHVFKAVGLENTTFLPGGEAEVVKTAFSLWSPEAGNFFYEGTGVITSIVSVFALYYAYRFIQSQRSATVIPQGMNKAV